MTREARYRDDMRDGLELRIVLDEQGDAYVSVLPEGHKIGPTVRLCASGGAGNVAPGLLEAVRHAFRAIKREVLSPVAEFDPKPRETDAERARLAVELCEARDAWDSAFSAVVKHHNSGIGESATLYKSLRENRERAEVAEQAWRAAKEGA